MNSACSYRWYHIRGRIQLCWKANIPQISQLNFCLLTSGGYLPKEYGWITADSLLPAIAFVHQNCGIITFHFSIWFPFVVPSPERFAVVFCTLLGTEVQTICWTWLIIAKFINTTGTLAEFATILWPWKKRKKIIGNTYFLCDWHVTHTLTEKMRVVLENQYFLHKPLIFIVAKTQQSSCHELSSWITANSAKTQTSRGEQCFSLIKIYRAVCVGWFHSFYIAIFTLL